MGKRYYCDYCHKTMVSSVSIIRTHNNGVAHQKILQEHYHQFKEPEEILAEESKKRPCSRFPKGECPFGRICRYTHYSREEIDALREYVTQKQECESKIIQPSFQDLYLKLQTQKSTEQDTQDTVLIDDNGVTHILPWNYNVLLDTFDVPPSIKRFKSNYFKDLQAQQDYIYSRLRCDGNQLLHNVYIKCVKKDRICLFFVLKGV